MSFDPMAAAIDWLDAYRASDLETILDMYADNAVIACECCVTETVTGKEQLRRFWTERFRDCPASDLDDLQPAGDDTSISFVAPDGVTTATLSFDADGKIIFMRCWPVSETTAATCTSASRSGRASA